jgi:2-polyprenyl-6-hydroxyphenyl methylase / 3-demethylubiquinone-9 3-methyltransferase
MFARRIKNNLQMYDDFAESWWSEKDQTFRSLKALTPFKLSLILENLGSPQGKRIIDLGCGGGLLSIPLAKAGGIVVGIDISKKSLEAARNQKILGTEFFFSDIRKTNLPTESADWVLLADVVDHLADYSLAIKEAFRVLKPNGRLYVGTINRTFFSRVFAIWLGEGSSLVPRGTHDWNLFIKPEELILEAVKHGFAFNEICGEAIDLKKTLRTWRVALKKSKKLNLAYSAFFTKN